MEVFENAVIVGKLEFRQRMGRKHYLSVIGNYALQDDNFFDLFGRKGIWGGGIGYSGILCWDRLIWSLVSPTGRKSWGVTLTWDFIFNVEFRIPYSWNLKSKISKAPCGWNHKSKIINLKSFPLAPLPDISFLRVEVNADFD